MVTSSAGVDKLLELENFGVRHSMVGFQLRYNPVIQKLKEIINNGSVGKVLSFRAEVCEYMPGFHSYEDYRDSYCSKRELGGGVVMTQIHELDTLVHLFGMPESVYALGGHLSDLEINVEDSVDILMRKKDISLSLRMDYLQKPRRRSGVVYGEKGWIEYDLVEHSLKTSNGDNYNWKDFDRNKMFIDEISNFFNSIKNAKETDIPLKEGLKSVRLAESILKSLHQNKEIKVVYGSRVLNKSRYSFKFSLATNFRVFANYVLTTFSNFVNRQKLTDAHTCYKVFRISVFKKLNLKENDFAFCPEVTTKLSNKKIKIFEVPISYKGRGYNEGKKIGIYDAIRVITVIIKNKFNYD